MRYSPSEVRWAFQYYLGRAPESEHAIDVHVNAKNIHSVIYLSKECTARKGVYYGADEFCCWRPGRPKVVVVSSCQAAALARMLAAMADVSVYACAIVKTQDAGIAAHLAEMIDDADFVISAPLTDRWGVFSQSSLKSKYPTKVLTYHRPFFEALHPDCTYLDGLGGGRSPVGDYHSRIVVDSFIRGLSKEACLERFQRSSYEEMGFPGIADRAIKKLWEKDEVVDIKIADWVLDQMRDVELFYTINHPTPVFFQYIAKSFLLKVGLSFRDVSPSLVPTVLSAGPIWPIYRDWGDMLGVSFSTGDMFWNNNYAMSLEEFVTRAYCLYTAIGSDRLKEVYR